MRYFFLMVFFCAFMACNMEGDATDLSVMDTDVLNKYTVAFYNVENLFDTKDEPGVNDNDFTPQGYKKWTKDRYFAKVDNISRVIQDFNKQDWPVLLGLAEVENKKVLEDLINDNDLIDADYDYVHFNSPDERGIDVALLYRKGFFKVLKDESIEINNPKAPQSKTRDILYVKGVFNNGEVFHFFVNHWSSRRDGTLETEHKRIFQAKILKEYIDDIQQKDMNAKIVVMGDFNDYPTDKSIKQILDASVGTDGLYNLAYALHMQDKGTINYKNDWGMFDQFIVSQSVFGTGLHLKKKQLNILDKDYLIWKGRKPNRTYGGDKYYGGFSDHLPIYIDLVE